ncbi:MAG: DUF2851 family protein [Saprospirales bacterium]|nr:MAG: DUF2851 family protein [Saprospirales bacterium]
MNEELMYYIWKSGQLFQNDLKTVCGKKITVLNPGIRNLHEGPDFLHGRLKINNITWNGQIEFHIKSSDWDLHGHQHDANYNNVILHIVMEDDKKVITQNGISMPTLELAGHIDKVQKEKFEFLMKNQSWVPCDPLLKYYTDQIFWPVYLSRLAVERLHRKTQIILNFLNEHKGDWEQTAIYFTLRYLIGKNNLTAIDEWINKTPWSVLRKYSSDRHKLESLVLGQAGFLERVLFIDEYSKRLKSTYKYLSMLHNLSPINPKCWKLFGLRPYSRPELRFSQFCDILHRYQGLMGLLLSSKDANQLKQELKSTAHNYWDNHLKLDGKETKTFKKITGEQTLNNVVLNAAAPLIFAYGQYMGDDELKERALDWWEQLPPEKNSIIRKWSQRNLKAGSAMETQGLLQLKNHYCNTSNCLNCSLGHKIMAKSEVDNKVMEAIWEYFTTAQPKY